MTAPNLQARHAIITIRSGAQVNRYRLAGIGPRRRVDIWHNGSWVLAGAVNEAGEVVEAKDEWIQQLNQLVNPPAQAIVLQAKCK